MCGTKVISQLRSRAPSPFGNPRAPRAIRHTEHITSTQQEYFSCWYLPLRAAVLRIGDRSRWASQRRPRPGTRLAASSASTTIRITIAPGREVCKSLAAVLLRKLKHQPQVDDRMVFRLRHRACALGSDPYWNCGSTLPDCADLLRVFHRDWTHRY